MNNKQPITDTMRICSKNARCVPCKRCLHFQDCARVGLPCSPLGLYMARLSLDVLPSIEAELRNIFFQSLALSICAPSTQEIKDGAYAVVRVYKDVALDHAFVRVLLTGEEANYQIKSLLFEAISKAVGNKNMKGKRK